MTGNSPSKKLLGDLWSINVFIGDNFINKFTKDKSMCRKFYMFDSVSIFINKYNILSSTEKQYVILMIIFFIGQLVQPKTRPLCRVNIWTEFDNYAWMTTTALTHQFTDENKLLFSDPNN
jgi:hypothetical protein